MKQQANSDACRREAHLSGAKRHEQLPPPSDRVLLIFRLSDRLVALPVEDVERIVPMAELASHPGMPPALEGVLNLAGATIPVLRLARLLGLAAQPVGLYSMLIILRAHRGDAGIAILADRVQEIVPVAPDAFLPIAQEDSLNGCATAAVNLGTRLVHLLSSERILLAREQQALSEFQAMEQVRFENWEISRP